MLIKGQLRLYNNKDNNSNNYNNGSTVPPINTLTLRQPTNKRLSVNTSSTSRQPKGIYISAATLILAIEPLDETADRHSSCPSP